MQRAAISNYAVTLMEEYIVKDGKKLRLGYTTGSCAAAASKAAAWMLLTGKRKERIQIDTPKGITLNLNVLQISMEDGAVSCAIEKDSGDDPDITKGSLIFAQVSRTETPGITIEGGQGVGRVTKRGLDQPIGAAAINSVPRQMIRENLEEVCRLADYHGGLSVVISVPDGERLAKKTFNPRLGIVGGISILGTTGIVEPMSEQALVDTIRVELRQRKANGVNAPEIFKKKLFKKPPKRKMGDMIDYVDEKVVSFEELDDDERTAASFVANLIAAVLFLIPCIIFTLSK